MREGEDEVWKCLLLQSMATGASHGAHTGPPLLGLVSSQGPRRSEKAVEHRLGRLWKRWGWLKYGLNLITSQRALSGGREICKTKSFPCNWFSCKICHLYFLQYSCCTGNLIPFSEVGEWGRCVFWVSGSDAAIRIHCSSSLKAISGKPHVIVKSFTALRWIVTHQYAATPQDNGCHQRGVL